MFPPVDPTRRRFLTVAAVGSMAGAGTLAAAALTPNDVPQAVTIPPARPDTTKAGPELRAAVIAIGDANDALTAALAVLEAGVATVNQWEQENPQPTSNPGKRRWAKKYRAYSNATTEKLWEAVVDAEQDFKAAQVTLAKIKPADQNELYLMVVAALLYDRVKLTYTGREAIISYGVAMGYFRLNGEVQA